MICTLCEKISKIPVTPPWVCGNCLQEISTLRLGEKGIGEECYKIFSYEGPIRTLLLRAKVQNDGTALEILGKISFEELNRTQFFTNTSYDLVIPSPSSFWGRVRGRFDVAKFMCESWFPAPRIIPSFLPGTFWKKKRAGQNFQAKPFLLSPKSRAVLSWKTLISKAKTILVVDDIMTTGFTMASVMSFLRELGAPVVDGLVLATSLQGSILPCRTNTQN